MPTYEGLREEGGRRPRFFEDWSADDQEAFMRSLRRNERLRMLFRSYKWSGRPLPIRELLKKLLLDRSMIMLGASVLGLGAYRFLSGNRGYSLVLLVIFLGLFFTALAFRAKSVSRLTYKDILSAFE